MACLSDEIARQIESKRLTQVEVAERSGISQGQISKWLRGEQTSISEEQLSALAPALSDDPADHAALIRSHLLDENRGPGCELIRIEIDHPMVVNDRPRPRSKGEKALAFLSEERLRNRDLNELLIDLARVLGGFETQEPSSARKAEIGAEGLDVAKGALKKREDTSHPK